MTGEQKERYSYTKLNAFHTCPYSYKLTYIDHIKGEGNCFASYGSEVHSLMERYAKGELDLFNLVSVYEWEFDTAVPEPFPSSKYCKDMRALYFEQGREFLANFQGYDDREILAVEKNFTHPIDDWLFTGIIDLIYKDKDGRLVLQDYKSKGSFASKKEIAQYARQLYLYSIYAKDQYGKYPDLLRFHLFRKDTLVDVPFNETDLSEAVSWARDTVKSIRECEDFAPSCEKFFAENLCNHRNTCTLKNF